MNNLTDIAPMRNGHKSLLAVLLMIVTILAAGGCGGAAKAKRAEKAMRREAAKSPQIVLEDGYRALENQQYSEAIAKADEFLAGQQAGEGTPEALYLKGRGFEGKNLAGVTEDEARENLQAARTAYIQALEANPKQPLASYLRTSLGNVAYFQDDYQTAIAQLTAAYDSLDRDELKAWAMYRIGLSQQRLARFDQADQTFREVQQFHANTVPAQRAREHQGARAFYVQLATFAQPGSADRAITDLKRQGVSATRVNGPEGRAFLRVGPIASYAQAQFMRNRFLDKYPDAVIIP